MKTATEMTEKQRRAVEAMERVRNEGMSLSDYAKAHGLVIRELYDAIAGLRRKELLAQAAKRKRRSKFVAVRVAPERDARSQARACPSYLRMTAELPMHI